MSSREQFEAWLSSEYQWANDALNEAHFHGNDATGYYTGGDFIYDGRSCSDALFWAWRGWQESHKQGEAKCAELAAELKQSQIDAGCYKKGMEASNERLVQVASENAGLKKYICDECYVENIKTGATKCAGHGMPETPATDSFLAEVRAQAHKEGAYFVANRMLAAWETGFIEDTAKNAADIARMILTSTEFMANAPEGDFDRTFADGVLEDIAAQLRQEAAQ